MVRGRREKSSSLNGPRLRGRATSIPRVIPSGVGRAPKISNARVIEEPPRVECIKMLSYLRIPPLPPLPPPSETVLVFPSISLPTTLSCFSTSLSIVVSFPSVRDNDTHTLSLGNNINGFVYPQRPSEIQQKEHRGDPLREEARP